MSGPSPSREKRFHSRPSSSRPSARCAPRTIQPQVEGFIRQILVQSGERVRAGSRSCRSIPTASGPRQPDRGAARRARGGSWRCESSSSTAFQTLQAAGASPGRSSTKRRRRTRAGSAAERHQVPDPRRRSAAAVLPGDRARRRHRRRHPGPPGRSVTPDDDHHDHDQGDDLEAYIACRSTGDPAASRPTVDLLGADG